MRGGCRQGRRAWDLEVQLKVLRAPKWELKQGTLPREQVMYRIGSRETWFELRLEVGAYVKAVL